MTIGRHEAAGLETRLCAAEILEGVLRRKRALDAELEAHLPTTLDERDRGLVRMLVTTALRRLGTLRTLLGQMLQKGLPEEAPRVETALLLGATQILWLDVPDHAAVDLSVRLMQGPRTERYRGLVNAVLRRLAREGADRLAQLDAEALDTPSWLFSRWTHIYGADTARRIAAVHAQEGPLDLSVRGGDAPALAERLGGQVLFTATVRLAARGAIQKLPGYDEGLWWVQDAAASLPARLLGPVAGRRVADLCAAPGGKAAQLAAAGARVTAVDRSPQRLERLKSNLQRLRLEAEIVAADVAQWTAEPFDAVLLDPPCMSTGTIRRHPDVPWLKREGDLATLAALQRRLLDRAATLVKPGGLLVYCTCSLEPEEGEAQISSLIERDRRWRRRPLAPAEVFEHHEFITPQGDLRTLPCHLPNADPRLSGVDGFYAARLERVEP